MGYRGQKKRAPEAIPPSGQATCQAGTGSPPPPNSSLASLRKNSLLHEKSVFHYGLWHRAERRACSIEGRCSHHIQLQLIEQRAIQLQPDRGRHHPHCQQHHLEYRPFHCGHRWPLRRRPQQRILRRPTLSLLCIQYPSTTDFLYHRIQWFSEQSESLLHSELQHHYSNLISARHHNFQQSIHGRRRGSDCNASEIYHCQPVFTSIYPTNR